MLYYVIKYEITTPPLGYGLGLMNIIRAKVKATK